MVTITINDEAARLLQQLADREGKTVTEVIIEAVSDKLDRDISPHLNEERDKYWSDFGDRVRAENPDWDPHADIEALYDPETGLPV